MGGVTKMARVQEAASNVGGMTDWQVWPGKGTAGERGGEEP